MRKIAYVLGEFPSLSETFIYNELTELKRQGLKPTIFALTPRPTKIVQKPARKFISSVIFPPQKISLHTWGPQSILHLKKGLNSFWLTAPFYALPALNQAKKQYFNHFFLAVWLRQKLEQIKVQHIHAHFYEPSLVACIASLMLNLPFSFTVHSHLATEEKYWLKEKVKRAKFVVTVGKNLKKNLLKITNSRYQNKIHVVYSGLDSKNFHSISSTRPKANPLNHSFTLITICRLVKHKGVDILLHALTHLKNEINFKAIIIGTGPEEAYLKSLAKKLKIGSRIHFLGNLTHSAKFFSLLAASDIFVLPCVTDSTGDQDGLPVAILEAMACGLPVISTKIAAIPEAVTSASGLVVNEKNPLELARALKYIYRLSPAKRHEFGENGQNLIRQRFNLKKNVSKLIELFEPGRIL